MCYCRNKLWLFFVLVVCWQSLLVHGQGPGPGPGQRHNATSRTESAALANAGGGDHSSLMQSRAVDMRIQLEIAEERPAGTVVGVIPTKPGFTYRFNESPREFKLNGTTGEIVTALVLDRESLPSDRFDLVILSSQPTYPIEVRILVTDINDNAPAFPEPTIEVSFSESANAGTRVILDTASDGDAGDNDVTTNYDIVGGNDDSKFKLAVTTNPSGETPYLHLETTGKLDRETRNHYRLNISAQDGGRPANFGYLIVNITIVDVNDNPPIFDHSDYVVSLNESVPPGTHVLQVTATDNDAGENARVTYYISESETQFAVDAETGAITTTEQLHCQRTCPPPDLLPASSSTSCNKSCVFTVFARDHGNPRQDGRTYVTVNLLDANDHDPIVRFRYFPATADFATVDENAQNGSVVAAVSVIDFDEGANGETTVEIVAGNELLHFRLEETPSFHIVRVNGVLDREKIGKYNLTILATDSGSPARKATAFLIIHVNDVNDHEPIFEKSEYSAVLSELVPVGTYVAGITATDQDTGINSNIFYAIVAGNEQQWFDIDAITGLITTHSRLDRERQDAVELRISARDGGPNPRWAYTHIKITILDENDERPMFVGQREKRVELSENTPPNTMVALLTAVDHDQGTNGSVSYAFDADTEQRYPAIFAIDTTTGRVTTRTKLDRELIGQYEIKVVARDQGNPPLSSTATVVLRVADANDNSPEFYPQQYLVAVSETLPVGQAVTTVTAMDEDEGENAQITYSIKSGAEGTFDIDEQTGVIRLRGPLNSARKSHYKLKVAAKDQGDRKAIDEAVVEILVENGPNVQYLEFDIIGGSHDGYHFVIEEDAGKNEPIIGRHVGKVNVKPVQQQAAVYSIIGGDQWRVFQIDENTGIITTAKRIDREKQSDYRLTVVARAGFQYGTATVDIAVQDVNDNPPRFFQSRADARLVENWPAGHEIHLAAAEDSDAGNNSRITYSLSVNPHDLFTISPQLGMIYLNRPMQDQQYDAVLTLEVTAADGGSPPLTSRQSVTVHLEDVNDHTPVFEYSSYETSLLETISVNERFFSLSAVDEDRGDNGRIFYHISEGNEAAKFGIFPDGMLYVKSPLDREAKDYYALSVVAKDGGAPSRSSTVSVVIHVIDENDNAPQFTNETFTFYIPENEAPDSYVGRLTATDNDVGRNAELTFSIGTSQTDFSIDPKSGFIKTLRYFDRERLIQTTGQDYIALEAIVSDNGVVRLRHRARIHVHILDVNDNAPSFQRLPYKAQVSEGAAVDTMVFRVVATDADDQLNGGIFYYIVDGNRDRQFRIDEATGQIVLNKPLDRESVDRYTLTVGVRDAGQPNLSTSTSITIEVVDENDNAPEFMHSEAKVSASETLTVGSELVTFQATDADLGVNGEIAFGIGAGNMHDTFRIDAKTGVLYLEKPLDYEMQRSYQLNITASDQGSPSLVSSIAFLITVEDANDNAPIFPSTAIVRQIQEGIPLNTPIVTVTAEDPDSGLNSRIRYSLIQQEPSVLVGSVSKGAGSGPHFAIRPDTGVVYVVRPIDREFADTFRLTVVATDQAEPASSRMSAEKLVTVIVEDVNDNAPTFTSVNAGLLPRGAERGHEILRVHAADPDANTNGLVTYELVSGDSELFAIERSTGRLTLRKEVATAAAIETTYQLSVRATDEAVHSQRKSTETQVTVISAPTADETLPSTGPVFTKKLYTGSVAENEPAGTNVLTVNARYAGNPLADIEYFIYNVSADHRQVPLVFDMDPKSGVVSTSAALDREATSAEEFELDIIAVTRGTPTPQTSVCKARVKIVDKNDSPPVFRNDNLVISVSEDLIIGQTITTVTATDLDKTGSITYTLISGDDGKFSLDSSQGLLTLRDTLNRESQAQYKLTVRADDGEQFTEAAVIIKVVDTNDNSPTFTEAAYSFDIPEDTGRGAFVGAVVANDMDEGINAQVSYTVLSDWGNDVFSLNPQSGVFTLTSRLDYEQVQHYIFVVQAQDTGRPSLSSTVTVYFNVLDLNDNAPLFDPMSYSDELYENITVGSSVITVSATDQDSGDNGKLVYSIIGGNENDQFQINQNGTITTSKSLDRETQSLYNLVVMATDQAKPPEKRLSSTVQVTIILKDVNDMAPEFVSANETYVMENIPVNTVVMAIKAIDRDEGRNSYIEYSLAAPAADDGCFTLGPVDGLLRVSSPLDRESRANYSLRVTAYDRGLPSRSQSLDVVVRILDENDNGPLFDPKVYSASVSENATTGLSVMQVTATDMDEGLNGRVRYTIVGGDVNFDFHIGEDSGVIRVAKNLNFERKSQYVLTVQAEDSGNDVRYDTATATVTVLDMNDNAPTFLHSPYVAYVMEENGEVPSPIVTVTAHDADSPPFNKIRYLIKDGDKGLFRINATTGQISVLRSLDRESQSRYEVVVVAMDSGAPVLTGTGTVVVVVEDVNDHTPEFWQNHYKAEVLENEPAGSPVVKVSAFDRDAGANALITYALKTGTDHFRIDAATGHISTNVQLDREDNAEYELVVVASDSSLTGRRTAEVNVTVLVNDVNDNPPVFSTAISGVVYVADNIQSGQFVTGTTAVDADSGPNGKIVYQLSGPDAGKFTVNQDTGVIKSAMSLSSATNPQSFQLQVRASDSGVDQLSATHDIEIRLRPADLFPTIRGDGGKSFTFSEQVENRVFTTVSATSPKTGATGQIHYGIAGGNTADVFTVNRKTGQVSIGTGLDYEVSGQYELWIEARDSDDPALASVTQLHINVTDFNDNTPIFDQVIYYATILEEQFPPSPLMLASHPSPLGGSGADGQPWQWPPKLESKDTKLFTERGRSLLNSSVLNVHATDLDSGRNGLVRYQLRNVVGGDSDSSAFSVDAESGKILTNIKLDREEVGHYVLVVEAVDQGAPQRTGTATVSLTVADKNDNPPRFTRLFSVNVTENAAVGTFVIQVTSSDRDVGANANATYSFTENPSGKFRIDPVSGNVTVAGVIDRETKEEYLLKVSAVDGSWRAETPLTITVQDQNDNAPEFDHSFYSFNFAEMQRSVAFVGQVTAVDRDKPGPNAMIAYSLKHPSEFFTVDPTSGDILSKQTVRYKQQSGGAIGGKGKGLSPTSPENVYTLWVVASDNGKPPLSSECLVNVNVVSAKRSAPRFDKPAYYSPVPDSAVLGQNVLQLMVTPSSASNEVIEEISGTTAEVEYVKVGGNGSDFFRVEKETGWVTVAGPLFGRRDMEFQLTVRAVNPSSPAVGFDETSIRLVVTGENRHAPIFTALSYQIIVAESEPLGSVIVSVTASDNDAGPNGAIRYAIAGGNQDGKFAIDTGTGAIRVADTLDYDVQQKFTLNITASDSAFEPKSATATLTVLLTDVNDNPPRFNRSHYDGYVAENAPPDTFVIDLLASDADSTKNAIVQYSIIGGSGKELFAIDSETGAVTTKSSFDFEEKTQYELDVLASNPDSSMFGSTVLRVHITGRNEFFPAFIQPVFQFTVSESVPVGASVGIVQATDRDNGDDGKVFYLLVGSSNDRGFHIHPETGVITVARPLDRESNLHFVSVIKESASSVDPAGLAANQVDHARIVLSVMAKNRGGIRGNDTDEAQVIISIQDGNDPPVFIQPLYTVQHVAESAPVGTKVVTVQAVDKDVRAPNNEFTYSILAEGGSENGGGGKVFRIDPRSGLIETAGLLDRERQSVYNVTVGAVDRGTPPQTGTTLVRVIVQDVNDNAPTFDPAHPIGAVYENEPPGTSVMTLKAIDADQTANHNGGPFSFALVGGRDKDSFVVDKETGVLRTSQPLDREQLDVMEIVVEIGDGGSPPLKSQWPVTVNVLDRNDNPSSVRAARIIVNTFTETFNGGRIADVRPNDVDMAGQYQCRIVSGAANLFSVVRGCQLHASRLNKPPPAADYPLKIAGNDGAHAEVTSTVSVSFVPFDNASLQHGVTLRLFNTSGQRLLVAYWQPLTEALQSSVSSSSAGSTVHLYSIHQDGQHVDVTLAVRRTSSSVKLSGSPETEYWNRDRVAGLLETAREAIQSALEPSVRFVTDYTPCRDEQACENGGQCTSTLRMSSDELETVDSPSLVFTAPRLQHHHVCACPSGFSGPRCQLRQDPCSPTPCRNGAACTRQGSNDFQCSCPPAYHGKLCDQERSRACEQTPCRNGGSCQEAPEGSYFCLCRPGYRGNQCELTSDSCRPNPCLNGGVCENRKPGYRCLCSDNYFGTHCERSSFGFAELSYMSFPPLEASTNDISIVFSTNMADALLVYNFGQQTGGRSDFVALEIHQRRARFMFGGSQTAIASITVPKSVADGKWYRVTATRNGRIGSLSVGECSQTGESCRDCRSGDRSCSADYTGPTGTLNFSNHPMYLGGVPSIESIRDRLGQVHSHDFVGCIQSVSVNGRSLNMAGPLKSRAVTNTCQRKRDVCDSHSTSCGDGGTCLEGWSNATCICQGGLAAPNCFAALEPISITGGSYIEFHVSERHQRRQILRALYHSSSTGQRWKRETTARGEIPERFRRRDRRELVGDSVSLYNAVSISFRTVSKYGYLFFAATNSDFTALRLQDGILQYSSKYGSGALVNMTAEDHNLADGNWHNVTLVSKSRTLHLLLDGFQVAEELDMSSVHDFMDPYLTSVVVGSVNKDVYNFNEHFDDFEGCMANFTVNGEIQPMNGSGGIFDRVVHHGRVLSGCSHNIAGASTAPDPLSIGITLVIVFFVILLVAILISFVVVRVRRQQRDKKTGHLQMSKHHGGGGGISAIGDPTRSMAGESGGYIETSDVSEDGCVRPRLGHDMTSKKFRERQVADHRERDRPQRPDIIEREVVNKSPGVPLGRVDHSHNLGSGDDGSMTGGLGGLGDCEPPEHYDLENASSIAPSDIDIVYHYKGYRDGNIRKYKTNPPHVPSYVHKHNHRHSPHSFANPVHRESPRNMLRSSPAPGLPGGPPPVAPPPRESPGVLKMQSTPLARLSPSSELSQQTPRILTLQDLSGKPLQTALLATSQVGGVKDVMSNSERSLNSPVSQLSQSTSSIRNASSQAAKKKKKAAADMALALGLTAEEIERLNSRPRNSSLVSTLDAVSSSSDDGRPRSKEKLAELMESSNTELLETAESSTDESGNDSFTCSEFEYENNYEKVSRDFGPGNMIFSKLAEVDNENEHDNESAKHYHDGFDSFRGSLSTLVASDDDLSNISAYKPPNGSSLGWDYLLNWGPNFESLVGVFKDIAELPDCNNGRVNGPSRLVTGSSKVGEEYI